MQISTVRAAGGKVSLRVDGETVFVAGEIDQLSPRDFMAGFFEIVHNMALGEGLLEVKVDVTDSSLPQFLGHQGVLELDPPAEPHSAGEEVQDQLPVRPDSLVAADHPAAASRPGSRRHHADRGQPRLPGPAEVGAVATRPRGARLCNLRAPGHQDLA